MNMLPELDKHYPPCGPCAFCGFHDKRHRLWDMILNNYFFGHMAPSEIAKEYEITVGHVIAVITEKPYRDELKRVIAHDFDPSSLTKESQEDSDER